MTRLDVERGKGRSTPQPFPLINQQVIGNIAVMRRQRLTVKVLGERINQLYIPALCDLLKRQTNRRQCQSSGVIPLVSEKWKE